MIMAGGVGKRLRPYTYALPKPLLTANNISPLESCIKNIKKFYKSEKIYLAVCYKKKISGKFDTKENFFLNTKGRSLIDFLLNVIDIQGNEVIFKL